MSRSRFGDARFGERLLDARRRAPPGPYLHGGGGSSRPSCRVISARFCGVAVSTPTPRHRRVDGTQRRAVRGHRRHAARLQLPASPLHVWMPIALNETDADPDVAFVLAAARLKPGLSSPSRADEIEALARRLEAQTTTTRDIGATLTPLDAYGVAAVGQTLTALVGAVAVVLLIACVNVANLLARASRPRAARSSSAYGARRVPRAPSQHSWPKGSFWRWSAAWSGSSSRGPAPRPSRSSLPEASRSHPSEKDSVTLNISVLLFTAAVSVVTGLLFSLAPLAGLRHLDAGAANQGKRRPGRHVPLHSSAFGARRRRDRACRHRAGRRGSHDEERVAACSVDPGLDPRNVLLLSVALPQPDFYGPPLRTGFCEDVQREVGALPGVRSVGAVSQLPLEGSGAGRGFDVEGRPIAGSQRRLRALAIASCVRATSAHSAF